MGFAMRGSVVRDTKSRHRGGHRLQSAGAGRTSASGPTDRGRVERPAYEFCTSALASRGGLGGIHARKISDTSGATAREEPGAPEIHAAVTDTS